MSNILQESNIVPSNDKGYKLLDIRNAIYNKLGIHPAIECRKEDGKNWLVEVRICFDKNLGLHDCDGIKGSGMQHYIFTQDMGVRVLTNCDLSQDIMYPHFGTQLPPWVKKRILSEPPKRLYVQLYKLTSWLQWFTL